jgi:hypothetical protein
VINDNTDFSLQTPLARSVIDAVYGFRDKGFVIRGPVTETGY